MKTVSELPSHYHPNESLFDKDELQTQISQGTAPAHAIKKSLHTAYEKLDQQFLTGTPVHHLIYHRAWLIDQILLFSWQTFHWSSQKSIGLFAVGGYGRGELHPHSDIDILILYTESLNDQEKNNIEQFLTLMWDCGLNISHSVRNLLECQQQSTNDITIVTSIMESRPISSQYNLHNKLKNMIGSDLIWPSDKFFTAKWQEQKLRHNKYNNIDNALEPDIKESPGGLRDIQMIGWVAKRHFKVTHLYDLVAHGFLTQAEYDRLISQERVLWKIRYGLHLITSRNENRLLFDHQRQLSAMFLYQDNRQSLAVEQFMRVYYRSVNILRLLNDVLLQHFDEVILKNSATDNIDKINQRFQIRNHYIETCNPDVFRQTPYAILEIFVLMGKNSDIQGVRASTIRDLYRYRYLIDEEFLRTDKNTALFMELLKSDHLAPILRCMKRYGILGRYLPEFGKITGQMQHDLFHIYTVDDHTLMVVEKMQDLAQTNAEEKYLDAAKVFHQLPVPELLVVAGLYHDIAKGRGGDHSTLGAADAADFCKRHKIGTWGVNLVQWLVQNHLIMSQTAQKKDISDPDIILDFANLVSDQAHLDYLYVLTAADISATNPTLWNSWRASLLQTLYRETSRALLRGLENPIDKQERIKETQASALNKLLSEGCNENQILKIWALNDDDYFLRVTSTDIVWHTRARLPHNPKFGPLIVIKSHSSKAMDGGTKIMVYTKHKRHLFALFSAALDAMGLNILDARIFNSSNNYSLHSYTVLDEFGSLLSGDENLTNSIKNQLIEKLTLSTHEPTIVRRRTRRQLKHFSMPTQTNINLDEYKQQTVIEIITPDRPGLLARIAQIFMEFDLLVQSAKIATFGERVEDVFWITDHQHQALVDDSLCQRLMLEICMQLDRFSKR